MTLAQLVECMQAMRLDGDRVRLEDILAAVGHRSFGPLLLVAGLVTLAPVIGDIPGVPTLMATVVLLVAGQLLLGRDHVWLPAWLLRRSLPRAGFDRALHGLHRAARGVDRVLRVRLTWLTGPFGTRAIAGMCLLIALAMPPMELVPFTANGAGLALTTFGLGLVADDGLLALLAHLMTLLTFALVVVGLW